MSDRKAAVPIVVTLFRNVRAQRKWERVVTFDELAERIRSSKGRTKGELWLLKLATFGDLRTAAGCLRHDANVRFLSGIEVDYDAEIMPFDEAVRLVRARRVRAIVYTSPSHRPDTPRWRALFPFAGAMLPAGRAGMCDRANTLLGGGLSRETWTLSQAFYFGCVNEDFRLEAIEGDPIDTRGDLGESPPARTDLPLAVSSDLIGTTNIVEEGELTPYGEAALRAAATNILTAPNKTQERTLNAESYSIGRLAGAGGVPAKLALEILLDAADGIPDYDPAWPWGKIEKATKIRRGFAQGMGKPRPNWAEVEAEIWRRFEEAAAEDADA